MTVCGKGVRHRRLAHSSQTTDSWLGSTRHTAHTDENTRGGEGKEGSTVLRRRRRRYIQRARVFDKTSPPSGPASLLVCRRVHFPQGS